MKLTKIVIIVLFVFVVMAERIKAYQIEQGPFYCVTDASLHPYNFWDRNDNRLPYNYSDHLEKIFDLMEKAGIKMIKVPFDWSWIQPIEWAPFNNAHEYKWDINDDGVLENITDISNHFIFDFYDELMKVAKHTI